ncbi:hypothetical protein EYZ11_004465 [Aspergillus tanneri]|uniref:Uncharacterized protein n=1 Tax=Aspergillus tanneri TaxID=1220188 RepID=A0A4V6RQV5_9EURO|nr:hypothetical protein EYZ11_004465 [Aspergillus tanneri]
MARGLLAVEVLDLSNVEPAEKARLSHAQGFGLNGGFKA